MVNPRLHLDADTSRKTLEKVLLERGHDVTRTPNEWIALDADDATQLLEATAHDRVIFTFNIGDFVPLAIRYSDHAGIVLAQQRDWPVSRQIKALARLLTETTAVSWRGQMRWLNEWGNDE